VLLSALLCAVLLVGAFLLPNEFFDGYVHIARVVSGENLINSCRSNGLILPSSVRCRHLPAAADRPADRLRHPLEPGLDQRREELEGASSTRPDHDTCGSAHHHDCLLQVPIVVVSLLMYAACLTALVLLFQYFASGEQCGLQKFFISFCLIFTVRERLSCLPACCWPHMWLLPRCRARSCVRALLWLILRRCVVWRVQFAFSMLAISGWVEHGALLPSAVVSLYMCTFNGTSSCSS
jgi:hypothetical protein